MAQELSLQTLGVPGPHAAGGPRRVHPATARQAARQAVPSDSVQSDIPSRTGSSRSGSLPREGPGRPRQWPAAPPKQGPGLNLPRQGWSYALFGLGFLTSDFSPWVPFGSLPPAWCHVSMAIFPVLSVQMEQNSLLVLWAPRAPLPLCPVQAIFCPSPLAKALPPLPEGQ